MWTDKMYKWQKVIRNLSVVPSSKYVNTIEMRIALQPLIMSIKNTCQIGWARCKSKFVFFFRLVFTFTFVTENFFRWIFLLDFINHRNVFTSFCLINGIFRSTGGNRYTYIQTMTLEKIMQISSNKNCYQFYVVE